MDGKAHPEVLIRAFSSKRPALITVSEQLVSNTFFGTPPNCRRNDGHLEAMFMSRSRHRLQEDEKERLLTLLDENGSGRVRYRALLDLLMRHLGDWTKRIPEVKTNNLCTQCPSLELS